MTVATCISVASVAGSKSLSDFSARPLFARAPFALPNALLDVRSGCLLSEGCGQQPAEEWLQKNHGELGHDDLFSLVVALAPLADTAFGRKWLARTLTNPRREPGQPQAPLWRVQTMAALALAQSHAGRQTLVDAVRRKGAVGETASLALQSAGPPDGLTLLEAAGPRDEQLLGVLERSADLRAFESLRNILRRGQIETQTRAALILARQGNDEALELVSRWQADNLQDPRVLGASAEILLLFDRSEAVRAFSSLLGVDVSGALALAERYPRTRLAQSIVEGLGVMTSEQVRRAYGVLGTLRSNAAAAALARHLRQSPSADVALALASSPAANATALLRRLPMNRHQLRALVVRHFLSDEDGAHARETELRALLNQASAKPHLRATARWARAQLKGTASEPAWAKSERWARDQSTSALRARVQPQQVRRFAAIAELSRRGDSSVDPSVWLNVSDVDVKLAVLRGLAGGDGLCEGDHAATFYQREQAPRVRRALVAALVPCGPTASLTALLQIAAQLDPDARVRGAASAAQTPSPPVQTATNTEVTWLELGDCQSCSSAEISVHAHDTRVAVTQPAEDGTVILLGFPSRGAYARLPQSSLRRVAADQP